MDTTMKIIVNTPSEEQLLNNAVMDRYDLNSRLCKCRVMDENSHIWQFYTDGLIITDTLSQLKEEIRNTFFFESHIIAMVFHLKGNSLINAGGEPQVKGTVLQEPVHNIEVINNGNLRLIFEPGSLVDSFVVVLSKDFCLRVMPKEDGGYNHLLHAVEYGERASLSPEYLPLNQEMRRTISRIRNCNRKGSFHRLCLEIKIAELLMLQLEQYQLLSSERKVRPMLNNLDMDKLNRAKEILEGNFQNPPTIKNLSLMIGINKSKLKAGFKESYGSTIHSYILHLRMKKAYQLITEQNLLLKEVAMEVGYKNPSHFSAAFKQFYGIYPSKVANHIKAINFI